MSLDDALRRVIAEAVASGLEQPLAELREALETTARIAKATNSVQADPELQRLSQLDYLDAEEAGKLLRIGRHQVYRLVNAGLLRCTRFGKRQIFARAELDRFMSGHDHHVPEPMTPAARRRLAEAN